MCLFRGILLGVLLTVGGAFVSDTFTTRAASAEVPRQTMVNWNVVAGNLEGLAIRVRDEWNRRVG
jgi:hypothetical protein